MVEEVGMATLASAPSARDSCACRMKMPPPGAILWGMPAQTVKQLVR